MWWGTLIFMHLLIILISQLNQKKSVYFPENPKIYHILILCHNISMDGRLLGEEIGAEEELLGFV